MDPEEREQQRREAFENLKKVFPNFDYDAKTLPLPVDSKLWYDANIHAKVANCGFFYAAPFDARFPQQSDGAAKGFAYYIDYFRCKKLLGDDYKDCEFFKKVYEVTLPQFVLEQFAEWRENKIFPHPDLND